MTYAPLPGPELRADARRLYGVDPVGYEEGRPDYPERVYEVLAERCAVAPGCRVLEIGPGTGRVTRRLAGLGADVVAVEPDPELARYLREGGIPRLEVIESTFEEAALSARGFDAVVAGMAFHWVDQDAGLRALGDIVRPEGWVALWWTVYGDPTRADPYEEATEEVRARFLSDDPSQRERPFELDVGGWTAQLRERSRLVDVEAELIPFDIEFDIQRLRAFYGSMLAVRRLAEADRRALLDALADVAATQFTGAVERPFVTALYTGRSPARG